MNDKNNNLAPPDDDDEVTRHKFYTEASTRINRLDDSNDKLWGYVRKHEKFQDRVMTIGAVAVFFVGGIQVVSNLYLKDAINTQLEPIGEKVAKIEMASRVKEEADKQILGLPDQVMNLRQMLTRMRDELDAMKASKK
jgi:hypothetical protein